MGVPRRPRKLAPEELFEYAVKCLGARAYSAGELRLKLHLRAAHRPDVGAVIDRLKNVGYLNDQQFAENFAQARVENDGFGRVRILSDLRARQITGKMAQHAVESALDGKNESELIEAWIERRMPKVAAGPIEDDRVLAAAYRRLRRAGFTSGAILTALKQRAARPESMEEPAENEESEF